MTRSPLRSSPHYTNGAHRANTATFGERCSKSRDYWISTALDELITPPGFSPNRNLCAANFAVAAVAGRPLADPRQLLDSRLLEQVRHDSAHVADAQTQIKNALSNKSNVSIHTASTPFRGTTVRITMRGGGNLARCTWNFFGEELRRLADRTKRDTASLVFVEREGCQQAVAPDCSYRHLIARSTHSLNAGSQHKHDRAKTTIIPRDCEPNGKICEAITGRFLTSWGARSSRCCRRKSRIHLAVTTRAYQIGAR